ncbi:MAG: formyltransferase family protein [Trueperaceae bacterium]|nr:formyltransferase family protein [Trueperaceae bacterium]
MTQLRVVFSSHGNAFAGPALQRLVRHSSRADNETPHYRVVGVVEYTQRVPAAPSSFAAFAAKHRLPYQAVVLGATSRLSDPDAVGRLEAFLGGLEPDLGCVVSGPLLPAAIFERPRLGFINVHPALLPHYRGINPFVWPLVHGRAETGVTVHQISKGIDTGAIYKQAAVPIGTDGIALLKQLADTSAALLHDTLLDIASGRADPQPQPSAEGLFYARSVKPGEKLVDWEGWSAKRVYRFLRASYGIHSELTPRFGFVWKATGLEPSPTRHLSGRLYLTPRGFYVNAKDGRIALKPVFVPRRFRKNLTDLAAQLRRRLPF